MTPSRGSGEGPLLSVEGLEVWFGTGAAGHRAVDDVSFSIGRGEALGLVGASGSGKTTVCLSLLGLLPDSARVRARSIRVAGNELAGAPEAALRELRGRVVGMVFQEPSTALNPVLRIGEQIAEVVRLHRGVDGAEARRAALGLLEEVRIDDPDRVLRAYPHELSGGLRQRAVIAGALAGEPLLLVADEPTSALDATVQAELLDLLRDLRTRLGLSVLLVSHDPAVIADVCDRVARMRDGRVVESSPVREVAAEPRRRLGRDPVHQWDAASAVETPAGEADVLVSVRGLHKRFPAGVRSVEAVDGVDLDVRRGEILGLVGESGSGKSTLARLILGLIEPTAGVVTFDGRAVSGPGAGDRTGLARRAQIVLQDPDSALNPRMTAGAALAEVLRVHRHGGGNERAGVERLLERVGLEASQADLYPHELSGGQKQRVALARALAVEPDFLVLDEPVSSLDASVRERIVELLVELRGVSGLTYLFIAHDLGLVRGVCDRVAVMYRGRIVEIVGAEALASAPRHPYTAVLMSAVPGGLGEGARATRIRPAEADGPEAATVGCAFAPRCPHPEKDDACRARSPALERKAPGHFAACHKGPFSAPDGA